MKKILILLLTLFFSSSIHTQSADKLINAFSESYSREAEGMIDEAIMALKTYYSEDSYELNLRLGWLYYNKGDHFQSRAYYGKAMKLLPYAIEAKFGYVLPLAAMGNWTEVEKVYGEILKIDPNNTLASYRLGAIYYERKTYEKAYKYLEKVVNLYPFDYDSVVLFAWINLQLGNASKARAFFEKALMIQPASESAKEGLQLLN